VIAAELAYGGRDCTARDASNGGERNGSGVVARGISGASIEEGITHFSAVAGN
jgi:hypothetical protein